MGFSSGVWTPPSLPGSWSPAVSGQAATPTDWNTLLAAIATGLSTTVCRDGQSTITADIPFAGFRLKAVGNGILLTDAANLGQVQSAAGGYAADTGTADNYAIAPAPAITAYAVGQIFRWTVLHTNATTTPTLAVSGLTAGTIVWPDGSALSAGQLPAGANVQTIVSAVTTGTPTHQLVTISTPPPTQTAPTTQSLTSGSAATYTTPAGVKWIKVRIAGGGGGGGGLTGAGGTGGTTSFNSITAIGGTGGAIASVSSSVGGQGGIGGTGGSGTAIRSPGNAGGSTAPYGATAGTTAGYGGGSPYFGGSTTGQWSNPANGVSAAANTGAGGSGSMSTGIVAGPGGGSGECAEFIIGNPAGTYTYTIGAAGAAGTGTQTGGAGGTGFITVEEHYTY